MKHPIKIYNSKAINNKYRRFTILDRAVFKARQEIMAQEDAAVLKVSQEIIAQEDTAAATGNK